MKLYKKIICIVLLLATAVLMFFNVATIYDDAASQQRATVSNDETELQNKQSALEDRGMNIYDMLFPIVINGDLSDEEKLAQFSEINVQRRASGASGIPDDLFTFLTGELTWENITGLDAKGANIKEKDKLALLEPYGIEKSDFKLKETKEADLPRLEEVRSIITNMNVDDVIHFRDNVLKIYFSIDKNQAKVKEAEAKLAADRAELERIEGQEAEEFAKVSLLGGNQLNVSRKLANVTEDKDHIVQLNYQKTVDATEPITIIEKDEEGKDVKRTVNKVIKQDVTETRKAEAADFEMDKLHINSAVVNKSNGYPTDGNLDSFQMLIWVAFAMLILAALLMLGGETSVGDRILQKIATKQKTFKVLAAAGAFVSLLLIATTNWQTTEASATNQLLLLIIVLVCGVLLLVSFIEKSKRLYTIAAFLNLGAVILIVYSILRLQAMPLRKFIELEDGAIKTQPAVVEMNPWIMIPLIVLPIIALAMHIQTVHNTKRSMIYVFCTLLSAMAILPFWIMIVNATRSSQAIQQGVSLMPSSYLGYNWNVLATKNFSVWTGFRNSAIIAFGSTILSVYFSAMTAYGFKVYQFKGRGFLYAVVLAIIMIPGQVTGTGFYIFMYQLGLTNNFIPLIIPAIAAASTVFFFRQYLEANLQLSLVEAARIDGCNEFRTFNRIILPIMVPAMATMGIMAVIGSWNNYLTPLMLLSKSELKTLPMLVKELRGDIYKTEYGSIYLGLTLTALPLIVVYFVFSKYIIAGVALGGVKE